MEYFLYALRKYTVFTGRARRKQYWMFVLFNLIFSVVAVIADNVIGLSGPGGSGVLYALYSLVMFLPALAVGVRRLHDVGKSGWFTFILLVPLVGAIWLLVLYCSEGNHGTNEYGPDPKGELAF